MRTLAYFQCRPRSRPQQTQRMRYASSSLTVLCRSLYCKEVSRSQEHGYLAQAPHCAGTLNRQQPSLEFRRPQQVASESQGRQLFLFVHTAKRPCSPEKGVLAKVEQTRIVLCWIRPALSLPHTHVIIAKFKLQLGEQVRPIGSMPSKRAQVLLLPSSVFLFQEFGWCCEEEVRQRNCLPSTQSLTHVLVCKV